jgi:F0F1-type ATP synthase delta subunit
MRYTPAAYSHAFVALALGVKSEAEQGILVKQFWAAVEKNGDLAKKDKIVAEAERLLRHADGRNLWEIETARKLTAPAKNILEGLAKAKDVVREVINPELVAGARITKNGEEQLDVSLASRLDKLFSTS